MSEKNICPGCGRHCDLNEPHCGRGEEYRRTGKMPEQHEKGHHHGPGSVSEILSKLESAGWIFRTRNEADRRTTDVCLTDAGRELAAEALAQRRKRHQEMFSCLSEEERQELLSLLERVCTDWRTRYREKGSVHGHGRHHSEHHDGHGHHDGYRRHDDPHGHGGN